MNGYNFPFGTATLTALGTGALFWPAERLLVVSDLHLGKSERIARRGGTLLPPYETQDTLTRLEADIERSAATTIVCLGDSFDDLAAASSLAESETFWLNRLMAGRRWIWIAGNHDPAPLQLGGTHLATLQHQSLSFRHIAEPSENLEVSGHYHPKARLSGISRPCFLIDAARVILPSYGTYTGGLASNTPELCALMGATARAVLLGPQPHPIPMPR